VLLQRRLEHVGVIKMKKTIVIIMALLMVGSALAWNANPTFNPFEVIWNAINDIISDINNHDTRLETCENTLVQFETRLSVLEKNYTCFSLSWNDTDACHNHGECIAPNKCICSVGWTGEQCDVQDIMSCYGIPFDDPAVCTGHGTCVAADTCNCNTGWGGDNCDNYLLECFPDDIEYCLHPTGCDGSRTCDILGEWGVCEPVINTEVCNDKDDDCDGYVDEDFDLSTDNNNCGTCGNVCDSGDECYEGFCMTICSVLEPETACGPGIHCMPATVNDYYCSGEAGIGTQGDTCTDLYEWSDCAPGYACVSSGVCMEMCIPSISGTCPTSTTCNYVDPMQPEWDFGLCY
jgi:hypothetical protein